MSSYGHSASSHGALIDYFVVGVDAELPNAQARYSETIAPIPGWPLGLGGCNRLVVTVWLNAM